MTRITLTEGPNGHRSIIIGDPNGTNFRAEIHPDDYYQFVQDAALSLPAVLALQLAAQLIAKQTTVPTLEPTAEQERAIATVADELATEHASASVTPRPDSAGHITVAGLTDDNQIAELAFIDPDGTVRRHET